jgi:alkylation response protein AidB-like acyl-CoA dehydrogenase
MDFRLSSEQGMLRDGARRFVGATLDFHSRAAAYNDEQDHWNKIAELGWLMLPVPAAYEGLDGGIDDIAIIAEELGRGLALEPYVEAGFLSAQLMTLAGTAEQCAAILPDLAMGTARVAVALYEPQQGFNLSPDKSQAERDGDGMRLSGTKVNVEGGVTATHIMVSAVLESAPTLFLIPTGAAGIERIDYDAIDGRILSDFVFTNVALAVSDQLTGEVDALSAIAQAVDLAIIAQCAEALGGMDHAIELTAEYLKIRQQFGQPLANFQALQHGIANLFIEANDARSIVYRAMSMADAPPAERARAVSACKIKVMEASRTVTGKAVHYHGGIGVTTEYSVGHYLRRALMLEQRFGNSAYHFERMMKLAI